MLCVNNVVRKFVSIVTIQTAHTRTQTLPIQTIPTPFDAHGVRFEKSIPTATMEGNGELNYNPVHNLSTLYMRSVKSPSARSTQSTKPRNSLIDYGNSVPESPARNNHSCHGTQSAKLSKNNNDDNDDNDDHDNDADDEKDDDEDEEEEEDNKEEENDESEKEEKDDDGDHDDAKDDDDDNIVLTNLAIVDAYGDKGNYNGGVLRSSMKNLANEDPIPSSLGTMNYADGRVYHGHWKNGQWHGHGKTTYPNGDNYEGEYEEDQRHGIGVYKWNDGRVYQGNFQNDQRNGHGVYRWPDGSTYVGEFQDGKRHGEGTYSVSISVILL